MLNDISELLDINKEDFSLTLLHWNAIAAANIFTYLATGKQLRDIHANSESSQRPSIITQSLLALLNAAAFSTTLLASIFSASKLHANTPHTNTEKKNPAMYLGTLGISFIIILGIRIYNLAGTTKNPAKQNKRYSLFYYTYILHLVALFLNGASVLTNFFLSNQAVNTENTTPREASTIETLQFLIATFGFTFVLSREESFTVKREEINYLIPAISLPAAMRATFDMLGRVLFIFSKNSETAFDPFYFSLPAFILSTLLIEYGRVPAKQPGEKTTQQKSKRFSSSNMIIASFAIQLAASIYYMQRSEDLDNHSTEQQSKIDPRLNIIPGLVIAMFTIFNVNPSGTLRYAAYFSPVLSFFIAQATTTKNWPQFYKSAASLIGIETTAALIWFVLAAANFLALKLFLSLTNSILPSSTHVISNLLANEDSKTLEEIAQEQKKAAKEAKKIEDEKLEAKKEEEAEAEAEAETERKETAKRKADAAKRRKLAGKKRELNRRRLSVARRTKASLETIRELKTEWRLIKGMLFEDEGDDHFKCNFKEELSEILRFDKHSFLKKEKVGEILKKRGNFSKRRKQFNPELKGIRELLGELDSLKNDQNNFTEMTESELSKLEEKLEKQERIARLINKKTKEVKETAALFDWLKQKIKRKNQAHDEAAKASPEEEEKKEEIAASPTPPPSEDEQENTLDEKIAGLEEALKEEEEQALTRPVEAEEPNIKANKSTPAADIDLDVKALRQALDILMSSPHSSQDHESTSYAFTFLAIHTSRLLYQSALKSYLTDFLARNVVLDKINKKDLQNLVSKKRFDDAANYLKRNNYQIESSDSGKSHKLREWRELSNHIRHGYEVILNGQDESTLMNLLITFTGYFKEDGDQFDADKLAALKPAETDIATLLRTKEKDEASGPAELMAKISDALEKIQRFSDTVADTSIRSCTLHMLLIEIGDAWKKLFISYLGGRPDNQKNRKAAKQEAVNDFQLTEEAVSFLNNALHVSATQLTHPNPDRAHNLTACIRLSGKTKQLLEATKGLTLQQAPDAVSGLGTAGTLFQPAAPETAAAPIQTVAANPR